MSSPLEIADVLREYGDAYRQRYGPLPMQHERVLRDIVDCRTEVLGGHLYVCDECGVLSERYNSCRNRNCPKCQALDQARWLEKRRAELLPVAYFQIVFTLPDELLNPLFLRNGVVLYNLLFRSAAATLRKIAADPRHLGARIGFFAVLHTWGQQLQLHPHLHVLVPGGGISVDAEQWISSRPHYFLPIQVLSRLYRGKLMAGLRDLADDQRLDFPDGLDPRACPRAYQEWVDHLYATEWNVFCEAPPPGSTPENILGYLGRYILRGSISNRRLLKVEDDRVVFHFKDYGDGGQQKTTSLDAVELIRRFFLHVLPPGFQRVRSYGLFANRHRAVNLERCRALLGVELPEVAVDLESMDDVREAEAEETWQEMLLRLTGVDVTVCPVCHRGHLVYLEPIYRKRRQLGSGRSPPAGGPS